MKMHEQLVVAGLRFSQPSAQPRSEKAQKRLADRLRSNMQRPYVHVSRGLMQAKDGSIDFVHVEVPVSERSTLTRRVYPAGKTYNVGRNAAKRERARARH